MKEEKKEIEQCRIHKYGEKGDSYMLEIVFFPNVPHPDFIPIQTHPSFNFINERGK